MVVLGVASPFALYRLVNGGGNETGDRFLDVSLGRREGGRFGASHAKGHAAGGHATYHGQKNYGGFENGIAGITNHNPSVWDAGSNPKEHHPRFERDVSPPAPDYGVPHTIGTRRADTKPGMWAGSSRTATTAATSTRTGRTPRRKSRKPNPSCSTTICWTPAPSPS